MNRSYQGSASVGREYDTWTADGVLERYWGEHIHHGWYPEGQWWKQDFKQAKVRLIQRILDWADVSSSETILDIGCGIGGSSRYLAETLNADVKGITLSQGQVDRAQSLTPPHIKAQFQVADALNLPFADQQFDLVWSCESGEHMPDKQVFLNEMTRVLKPGGQLILATWCHRPEPPVLSHAEQTRLTRIYHAWALPHFISIEDYWRMATADPRLGSIRIDDWSQAVQPTWPHQLWLGLMDLPWLVRQGRKVISRSLSDAWAVKDMIFGYQQGTVRYGVLCATKLGEITTAKTTEVDLV